MIGVVNEAVAEVMREAPRDASEDLLGLPGNGPRYGSITSQEHIIRLRGRLWHEVALEMMRSSPTVATVSRELRSYLMSAEWSVEGGRDDIAEFMREALGVEGRQGRMATTLERAMRTLLYALDAGYCYAEERYHYVDGRHWLHSLEWRDPRAHERWITDERGEIAGVEQWVTDARGRTRRITIPVGRLTLATWDGEGYDYEGQGLLRPLWSHWRDQSHAMQMMAVAVERAAVPPIRAAINHPALRQAVDASGERVYSEKDIADLQSQIQQQMRAMRSVNKSVLLTPTEDYVRIEPLMPAGKMIDAEMFRQVIDIHEHRMTRAYLAQVLDLGITSTGARAVGEVHERSAERFCTNALEWLRDALRPMLRRLVGYNYGEVTGDDMPSLTWSGIRTPQFVRRLESLPGLAGAGLLVPTQAAVESVHRELGLPVPEEGEAAVASGVLGRRRTAADVLGG